MNVDRASYLFQRNRRKGGSILGTHSIRIMLALAVSLALVNLLVRLPIYENGVDPVGWRIVPPEEQLTLEQLGLETLTRSSVPTPAVYEETESAASDDDGNDDTSSDAEYGLETPEQEERTETRVAKLEGRLAVLDFAETMPEIAGGLGAYYINIQYPEAAAKAGIEGRLVLDFIVETNGRPTSVRVTESLHPLCDSAAVRALRQTRFVPGKQNGEPVRVRFRLPVRFELVERKSLRLPTGDE